MKKNKIIFLLKWKSRHLIPFLCVCFLLFSTIAFAQTSIVQRKVFDTQEKTQRGVNVKLKGMGVTNVLGGRVAGIVIQQSSDQPGSDAASLLIRGQNVTYIVDGVQRSFNAIDPNEIKTFQVGYSLPQKI